MQVSSRYGVSYPDPVRDDRPDIPLHLKSIVDGLEKSAMYGQGTFALRPISTGGSPGIQGRFYMVTDSNPHVLYYDYGTGWDTVGFLAAGSVGTTQLADDSVTGGALGAGVKIKQNTITSDNIAGSAVRGGGHEIAAGTITAADIANALKPSGGAGAGAEALRALGTAAGMAAAGIHHTQHGALGADPIDMSGYFASPTFTGIVSLAALIASGAVTVDGILEILNAAPSFRLYENDQALDEGMWGLRASGGLLTIETRHDDGTLGTVIAQVNGRVGAGINPTNLDVINLRLRNKGMNVHRHPFGTEDHHIESNSATVTTGTPLSVTFTDPFASAPRVIVVPTSGGGLAAWPSSITGSGCSLNSSGGVSVPASWLAEGVD